MRSTFRFAALFVSLALGAGQALAMDYGLQSTTGNNGTGSSSSSSGSAGSGNYDKSVCKRYCKDLDQAKKKKEKIEEKIAKLKQELKSVEKELETAKAVCKSKSCEAQRK